MTVSAKAFQLAGAMLFAATLSPLSPAWAEPTDPADTKKTVRDLYYGVVLYEFYQQNYFSAAVKLLAAQEQNRLPHHAADAELLLAGLYLSYGLHTEAEKIFQRLIEAGSAPAVRDRAWFYLGKIRYHKHLFQESEAALNRVGNALDETLQEEYRTLKANLLMAQKKYAQAAASLAVMEKKSSKDKSNANFVRFNLGVALIRAGREKQGINLLQQVAKLKSSESDQKALRDKANLALGYSLLKDNPIIAKDFLRRVRLHGPFSNRALLGLGWAEAALQRYEQALAPWTELSRREKNDAAVFESLLASGNALERLRAFPQAMQSYQNAITVFEQELATLGSTVEAVKAGRLWADLLSQVSQNEMGWFWEAELLPNTPETRYLKDLMAGHDFHEAIKNLRDLNFLANKLKRWETEIPALDHMLALRRETYQSQLNKLTPEQTLDKVLDARTSRDIYADELARIDANKDAYALTTGKEQILLDRLIKVEKRIWQLSSQPGRHTRRLNNYQDRYRFYKGLLHYDIQTTYAIRHRKVEKRLKSLNAELDATINQQNSLQRARAGTPLTFEGYGHRIDSQRARLSDLQIKVKQDFEEQQQQLQTMADSELDKLRLRLIDYLDQARFSLAHIQDITTDAANSGKVLP
jgi:tetratricopeptide (TPR) repeat protein